MRTRAYLPTPDTNTYQRHETGPPPNEFTPGYLVQTAQATGSNVAVDSNSNAYQVSGHSPFRFCLIFDKEMLIEYGVNSVGRNLLSGRKILPQAKFLVCVHSHLHVLSGSTSPSEF